MKPNLKEIQTLFVTVLVKRTGNRIGNELQEKNVARIPEQRKPGAPDS